MGGSRGGGVSSEVGIPEQKNTQQKKGLPPFHQSHANSSVHGGYMMCVFFTGFLDLRDKAVDRVGPRVCWCESAIEFAVFFFISA